MENNNLKCKNCGSTAVVKFGKYKNTQLYWCKSCQRKFKADDTLSHMKVSPQHISSALDMYYTGSSIKDICQHLKQQHNYEPPKSVVYQWIDKYSPKAIEHFRDYKPEVGDVWIAGECMLDLDKNTKVWFWDIIDAKTRFLLASRASYYRTSADVQKLMELALRKAGKLPKKVITDKLRSYPDGIELTFGSETEHIQSSPFEHEESTSKIERWHSTLKERTNIMKAFLNIDTLIQFTDCFLVYYNYFRPHEALHGKTPAQVANINYNVKNWVDLIHLPDSKARLIQPYSTPQTMIPKIRVKPIKATLRQRKYPKPVEQSVIMPRMRKS